MPSSARHSIGQLKPPVPEPPPPWWRRNAALAGLLIVAIGLAYAPVWKAGFIWDDDAHVTANPCIIGPLGLKEIWTTPAANYFPLVLTHFRALHAVWGLSPLPYHLVTVIMHALSAILLWRLLRQLAVPGAWLAAAVWALHPVQTESVAWISELKNTQSALFFLLSAWCFQRWLVNGSSLPLSWDCRYLAALACATLALLSKPSTVPLPLALALMWRWHDANWQWRRALAWLTPFFILSGLAAGWTVWEQKYHSLALGADWNQSTAERLQIAGRAVWFYLGKLAWPSPLSFVYPRWQLSGASVTSFGFLAAAIIGLVVLARQSRTRLRPELFAFGYFVALLFPVLGFFNVYYFLFSFVADHFQYLASIGPLTLGTAGAVVACRRLPHSRRWIAPSLAGTLLCGLGALTWRQCTIYRDNVALWTDTLAHNPGAWIAHVNLGNEHYARNRLDDAIAEYETALRLRPGFAKAHFDLGTAYLAKRDPQAAIPHFESALKLQPSYARAELNLGTALGQLGRLAEAADHFAAALRLKPDFVDAHRNLGIALLDLDRRAEAIIHLREAARLNPADVRTREWLERHDPSWDGAPPRP